MRILRYDVAINDSKYYENMQQFAHIFIGFVSGSIFSIFTFPIEKKPLLKHVINHF